MLSRLSRSRRASLDTTDLAASPPGSWPPTCPAPLGLIRGRCGSCGTARSLTQCRSGTASFGRSRFLSQTSCPPSARPAGIVPTASRPQVRTGPPAGSIAWRWPSPEPLPQRSHLLNRISHAFLENVMSKLAVRRSHAHPVVTLGVGEQWRRHNTSCNHPVLNSITFPQDAGEFGTPRGGKAQAQYLVMSSRHVEMCNKLAPNSTANQPSDWPGYEH